MKTLLAAILLTTSAAFAQTTVKYEPIAAGCQLGTPFLTVLTSGCLGPQIRVTAHPSNPSVVAFFILVSYRSVTFGVSVAQPHFTMDRDQNGDFVAVLPSGDMSDITISGTEVMSYNLITAEHQ